MSQYIIRYGQMRLIGLFRANGDDVFHRGQSVIVRTDRGLEAGKVLCQADEENVGQLKDPVEGQVLRTLSDDDAGEIVRIRAGAKREMEVCQEYVDRLELAMQLVDVEQIFGGERIIVYYLADGRVDFRELVRLLASEFQTRIEMRQIGVRDEAKLLADYGDCGKTVCCNTHLAQMPPVSMKMAKLQKATLDPTKISGRCGRLKCCLRYEYDVYEQLQKTLPPLGAIVECEEGRGKVVSQEVLAGQILVVTEDHRHILVDAVDVKVMPRSPSSRRGDGRRDRDSRRNDREGRRDDANSEEGESTRSDSPEDGENDQTQAADQSVQET